MHATYLRLQIHCPAHNSLNSLADNYTRRYLRKVNGRMKVTLTTWNHRRLMEMLLRRNSETMEHTSGPLEEGFLLYDNV